MDSIREDVSRVREAIKQDQELFNGLVASIQSAIIDCPDELWSSELAEYIAKRIVG